MNVGVIGLGKLGLPLLALLANSGHKAIGFDISDELLSTLRKGECPYPEPGLAEMLKSGLTNIEFASNIQEVVDFCGVCFVIVPTPSLENGRFDNSAIVKVCSEIGNALRNRSKIFTVDIVSTVMPNSCEGEIREALESHANSILGEKLGLCYNPEFIALGSVIRDMQYPDMQLLGASSPFHAERVELVLKSITRKDTPIRRMNLKEAELVKISVNNFVTTKIAFANMLSEIANSLGDVNIDVVTEAIGLDSRIGHKYLKAGTPYGGPCFPRDTRALMALLDDHEGEISIPKTVHLSNQKFQKYLESIILKNSKNKKVGILGLSYKPDTQVTEESSGLRLLDTLAFLGVSVVGWDPLVRSIQLPKLENFIMNSIDEFIEWSDVIYITRPIPEVDKDKIAIMLEKKEVIDFWRLVKKN